MKTLSPTLLTHLQGGGPFTMADLYTVTMASGTILRWTDYDVDITHPVTGYTHSASGPVLKRGKTRTIIGVEALIRWRHPQRGQLLPAEFLPMIEDHPLAIELGQWVIENALLQIERWRQVGLDLAVSVNIGRRHLMQADFVQRLREALAAHPRLQPSCLELELLELVELVLEEDATGALLPPPPPWCPPW